MTDAARPWKIEPKGLVVTGPITYTEWTTMVATANGMGQAATWAAGDAMLFGEEKWPEMYAQVADAGTAGSLANKMWVARRWPMARRTFDVHWSHYKECAPLPDDYALDFLKTAEKDGLTKDDLRLMKRAISRKCPQCKRLMVKRTAGDETLFVCTNAECEHQLPYLVEAPPKTYKVEAKAVGGKLVIVLPGELKAKDGTVFTVSYKLKGTV